MSMGRWCGLLAAMLAYAGCSSSLGSGNLDLPKEGVTAAVACADPLDPRPILSCPNLARVGAVTALGAVETLSEVAGAALGAAARWTGWIRGVGIAADGTVAAAGASGFTTAWCDGENELAFDTSAGDCRVRNACGCVAAGDCRGPCGEAVEPPLVDSLAAIAAAFPGAAATDTFDLAFDAAEGDWWQVRRSGTETWIRIDASTGGLVQ